MHRGFFPDPIVFAKGGEILSRRRKVISGALLAMEGALPRRIFSQPSPLAHPLGEGSRRQLSWLPDCARTRRVVARFCCALGKPESERAKGPVKHHRLRCQAVAKQSPTLASIKQHAAAKGLLEAAGTFAIAVVLAEEALQPKVVVVGDAGFRDLPKGVPFLGGHSAEGSIFSRGKGKRFVESPN